MTRKVTQKKMTQIRAWRGRKVPVNVISKRIKLSVGTIYAIIEAKYSLKKYLLLLESRKKTINTISVKPWMGGYNQALGDDLKAQSDSEKLNLVGESYRYFISAIVVAGVLLLGVYLLASFSGMLGGK